MSKRTFLEEATLHPTWTHWMESLRRRKLDTLVAWALDSLGPLAMLTGEAVQAGLPFLRPSLSSAQIDPIIQLLENPMEMRAFAAYLREESAHGQ
jgi:hypothetical protein